MTILYYEILHKRQTKANDCWYACIQMLRSWREGHKAKPQGQAVQNHRDVWAFGRTLSFGSNEGDDVKRDNGLVSIGSELSADDIQSVHKVLKKYGPVIIGGRYGPCGAGHFVVLNGVNTGTGQISRDNPAWGYGQAWKPLSYLNKMWTVPGSNTIDLDSAVALRQVKKT